MSKRDPSFDAYVLRIHEVLDRLDYYRLLGVDHSASVSGIKKAFYAIAAKFHPDRNRNADKVVQGALYDIFKRLNEAYRVLCDPDKRALYHQNLNQGKVRLDQDIRKTSVPKTPEDTIKSPDARKFYRQAVEELGKGNLMQADLHIKVARAREKGNEAIEALVEQIQAAKAEMKKKKKQKKK